MVTIFTLTSSRVTWMNDVHKKWSFEATWLDVYWISLFTPKNVIASYFVGHRRWLNRFSIFTLIISLLKLISWHHSISHFEGKITTCLRLYKDGSKIRIFRRFTLNGHCLPMVIDSWSFNGSPWDQLQRIRKEEEFNTQRVSMLVIFRFERQLILFSHYVLYIFEAYPESVYGVLTPLPPHSLLFTPSLFKASNKVDLERLRPRKNRTAFNLYVH